MKPRGRPRLAAEQESVTLSVRLTTKQFDATQRQADDARITMADWVRRRLQRRISVNKNRP